ncbi:putative membrane protein [Brevibacillus laterosporus GI-9]|nr:putative membrane protein [Brevibacillus laterosporus GI-9]
MNFRLLTFVLLLSLVSQTILTLFQAFAASDENYITNILF